MLSCKTVTTICVNVFLRVFLFFFSQFTLCNLVNDLYCSIKWNNTHIVLSSFDFFLK